jgi:ketosteroid isomerase-like protein
MQAGEESVRALVGAYAERLDGGDLDGVAALFEHAVVRAPGTGTERAGADAVRRMYDPVILYADGTPRTKHVLTNLVVDVDEGTGTATSRCAFTVWSAPPADGLHPVLAGRYHDAFEQVAGGWRFVERVIHVDLLGDLSGHMRRR